MRATSAEQLPFADAIFDTIIMTWTLCSIPDSVAALIEMRRVLKPGGNLVFVEHGLSPELRVARWQHRLTPCWKRIGGGCHLDRKMDDLIRAAGFQLNDIETGYMNGPKPMTFMYQGQAILSSGSYFPPPVRRVDIPKADGGTRPLGIPTVADRVAQEIARRYLEPCLEGENFSETSPCVPDFTIGDLPDRLPGFAVMNDRGAVLVEYAILLPVIVSVIFGGLDMSLATITAGRLQFAAEATAGAL